MATRNHSHGKHALTAPAATPPGAGVGPGGEARGFDPLQTCPRELRPKFERLAEKAAAGSLAAMAKLKCVECSGWSTREARRCEIRGCALWLRAGDVIKRPAKSHKAAGS